MIKRHTRTLRVWGQLGLFLRALRAEERLRPQVLPMEGNRNSLAHTVPFSTNRLAPQIVALVTRAAVEGLPA